VAINFGGGVLRITGQETIGNVTAARRGNNTTSSSLQLNGTRTFTVADGAARGPSVLGGFVSASL
jgi:hypothetical protein